MSGLSREATRETFWRAAGALLGELRARRGWARPELAERAGLPPDLVATYEQGLVLDPSLEDWWRLTIAVGIGLEVSLQLVEREAGVRLAHDVRLPTETGGLSARIHARQTGSLPGRGSTGGLAPRQHVEPRGGTEELNAFIEQLRDKRRGGDSQ